MPLPLCAVILNGREGMVVRATRAGGIRRVAPRPARQNIRNPEVARGRD
jgi:hypothetical protein